MFPKTFKTPKSNRQKKWQKELFQEIWNNRIHNCEVCWNYISEPHTINFAHILSKWVYPEYKFISKNIALVCSIYCHNKLDSINSGNQQELIKKILCI
jgi:hypothetical protein